MKIDQVLKELEATQQQFWNISPEAGKFLYDLVKKCKSLQILEIGSSNGYSTLWLAKAVLENKQRCIITIEQDIQRAALAHQNFEKTGVQRFIDLKIGDAKQILMHLDQEFDFIFIDARKSEYLEYLKLIEKNIKKWGIVVADNILYPYPQKVRNYVEYMRTSGVFTSRLENVGSGMEVSIKK